MNITVSFSKNAMRFLFLTTFATLMACATPFFGQSPTPVPNNIRKIVVLGFWPALGPDDSPRAFRSPFTGRIFMSEPVPMRAPEEMTQALYRGLVEREYDEDYVFLPPGQARGVKGAIESRGMEALVSIDLAREVGMALDGDAVLGGIIYRWKERQGSPYAAQRGASVAFEIFLLEVDTGILLWRWKFDKTQLPLSENLLDMETFLGGGGKWMTARELAFLGLEKFFKRFPLK